MQHACHMGYGRRAGGGSGSMQRVTNQFLTATNVCHAALPCSGRVHTEAAACAAMQFQPKPASWQPFLYPGEPLSWLALLGRPLHADVMLHDLPHVPEPASCR